MSFGASPLSPPLARLGFLWDYLNLANMERIQGGAEMAPNTLPILYILCTTHGCSYTEEMLHLGDCSEM